MPTNRNTVDTYDDEAALATYIWDHYSSFFTRIELTTAARSGIHTKGSILTREPVDEAEVRDLLARGPEIFRRRAASRVLLEHRDDVFINRCGRCGRIVRTPKAQQCLWCGYDWHPSPMT